MPLSVIHNKVLTIQDGTNTDVVRPSDWNSQHQVSFYLHPSELLAALQDSNGVSFGLGVGGVTASVRTDYLTTARASNDAIGLNTALTGNGVGLTANSNGLSLSVPGFLTTAANLTHSHGNPSLALTNISGTTASNFAGLTISLSAADSGGGADGYNFLGVNGASVGTAATIQLSNSNNVSFGLAGSTVTASASFQQTVQPVAVSVANGSVAFSTLSLADSNGVSFSTGTQGVYATIKTDYLTTARASNDAIGLNTALTGNGVNLTVNSQGLSLSVPAFLTTAAHSTHSHGNPSLALTNLSGTTASNSAGLTISLSAAVGGGGGGALTLSDFNTSVALNYLVLSNANSVQFGLSGSTLTASVDSQIFTDAVITYLDLFQGASVSPGRVGQGSVAVLPVTLPPLVVNRVNFPISYSNTANSSNSFSVSMALGFYSLTGQSLSLSTYVSTLMTTVNSGTAGAMSLWMGVRNMIADGDFTISSGNWWLGVYSLTSTSGGAGMTMSQMMILSDTYVLSGILGGSAAASANVMHGAGVYSTTLSGLPISMALSHIYGVSSAHRRFPMVRFGGVVVL